MQEIEKLNLGVVGAAGRGGSFGESIRACPELRLHAVCDIDPEKVESARKTLGAAEAWTDYEEMLDRSELDAVLIATPMQHHAPMSIAALRRGIHVLSEVTAAVSLEECRELVAACRESGAVYAMAENYIYTRSNLVVREMVRRGFFGELYYAEGEYIHELKGLQVATPWRRIWQTGVNGITYGTHSLGPILQWMEGDRVARLCCVGSGHHYVDSEGKPYENEDTCLMPAGTERGRLIRIRVDMLSNRPHATNNYTLQGTRGCFESARHPGEHHKIWLADRCEDPHRWTDLEEIEDEFLPDLLRELPDAVRSAGHGGGDYFVIRDFVDAVVRGEPPTVGIHEAMDLTLPGLVSRESIERGGEWLEVPDSRDW